MTKTIETAKTIAMLLIALVVAYGGVTLSRFADADDSPGGMVVGWLIVLVAVVIGAKAIVRRDRNAPFPGQ